MHLNSEHFSRWAGEGSQAIGLSPNPIFLHKRVSLQEKREAERARSGSISPTRIEQLAKRYIRLGHGKNTGLRAKSGSVSV